MRILKTQKEIIYEVAEETGLSKKHVEHIETQFWMAVRHFLTNPLITKAGILLQGWGKFKMEPYSLKKFIKLLLKKSKGKITTRIEFYHKLLKQYARK